MVWLYVPALPELRQVSGSPSEDIELWVTSSGTPTLRRLSWRGWTTRPWIARLSGTMSRPSLADRGATRWISSLPAFRVSPGAAPESAEARPTRGGFGPRFFASSPRCVRGSHSSRTARAWTPQECKQLCERLVTGASPGDSVPRILAPHTDVTGRTSWPTATATDAKASGAAGYSTESGRHSGTTLTDAAVAPCREYPTPTAQDYGSNKGGAAGRVGPTRLSLRADLTSGRGGMVLNPQFQAVLMGLPAEWTDCGSEVTEWSLWRSRMLSLLFSKLREARSA